MKPSVVVALIVLAALAFSGCTSNSGSQSNCNSAAACMTVTSASFASKNGSCGLSVGYPVKCHTLSVSIDNRQGKEDFKPAGGWTGVDGSGAGYDGSASGAPDVITAGGQGQFTVEIARSSGPIVTLFHHKGAAGAMQAPVPSYSV